jgi:hypothetical protein
VTDRRRTRTPSRTIQADAEPARRSWTVAEVRALGTVTDIVTAGQILGLSRNTSYRLARAGTFPIPVIKAGARYIVPVAAILASLHAHSGTGASDTSTTAGAT